MAIEVENNVRALEEGLCMGFSSCVDHVLSIPAAMAAFLAFTNSK